MPDAPNKYDRPMTPYRRALASSEVSETDQKRLGATYAKLNPAKLKRLITKLQKELLQVNAGKQSVKREKAA